MRLTNETKIFIGIIVTTIIIVGLGVFLFSRPEQVLSKEDLLPVGTITKGFVSSKVYLVEFSDFQCPACKSFKPVVDEITSTYKDKLYFGYRHFPLTQHPFAQKSAEAAEAANEQGKFWQMYDYLFAKQDNLSEAVIEDGAKELGLDVAKFQADMKSDEIKKKIEKDLADGNKFGISATPTFFLNGKKLNLGQLSDLKTAVEKAIQQPL